MMEKLWWDRPFTFRGVDLTAGAATLQLTTSYGAQQEIRIHTADDTLVDGFDLTTLAPKISSWHDVDAVLSKTDARYSWQVTKVNDGQCDRIAGTNPDLSLPLASIFKLYVLYAVADAVKAGTVSWDDQLTVTEQRQGRRFKHGFAGGSEYFGAHRGREDDCHQRQHGHRHADREGRPTGRRQRAGQRRPPRSGRDDAVPDDVRTVFGRLGPSRMSASNGSEAPRSNAPRC